MKIVSVTKVLGAYADFSRIPSYVLQAAAERGTLVHDICEKYVLGTLYLPDLIPVHVRGYFTSFKNWFDANVDRVFFVEKTFEDSVYGFRGRIDLGCHIRGEGGVFVVDYKTPILEASGWCGQLAAYRHLWMKNAINLDRSEVHCMSLRLDAEGRAARSIRYDYTEDDFSAFLNALVAYKYFT
jgi:hypothetical protein